MGDYEIKLNPYHVYNQMERESGVSAGANPEKMRITKSIWNPFANIVGGRPIGNYIEFNNAIGKIEGYLNRASEAKQAEVADHFGFHKVTQEEAKEYDEKAMAFLEELAANPSQIQFTKNEKDISPLMIDEGHCYLKATLPDGRGVTFMLDKSGKPVRLVWVNFDTTPNGVNYKNKPIDYDDVCYHLNNSTFSYVTNDGPDGESPQTSSNAYDVKGANNHRVQELTEQILSAYKVQ